MKTRQIKKNESKAFITRKNRLYQKRYAKKTIKHLKKWGWRIYRIQAYSICNAAWLKHPRKNFFDDYTIELV
jgi:hypothetical protein